MKRTVQQVRIAILKVLNDGKLQSFGDIERKVNTNWQTVRNHCKDLEAFKAINLINNRVKISKEGKDILKKL